MLVLNINRKPYMGSPMALSNLTLTDLERSKSRSLRFSVVGYLYGIDTFASSNITTFLDVTKRCLFGGRGFPLSQRSFLLYLRAHDGRAGVDCNHLVDQVSFLFTV